MKNYLLITFCCLVGVIGCQQAATTNDAQLIDNFANLECRAIALRQQRFTLADTIRSYESNLQKSKTAIDSIGLMGGLNKLLQHKEHLANQSALLADTIKRQLDTMLHVHFTDALKQQKFTTRLAKALKQKGCVEAE